MDSGARRPEKSPRSFGPSRTAVTCRRRAPTHFGTPAGHRRGEPKMSDERKIEKVSPNESCPCGKKKKYKQCCRGKVDWELLLPQGVGCRFLKPRDPFLTAFSKPFPPLR